MQFFTNFLKLFIFGAFVYFIVQKNQEREMIFLKTFEFLKTVNLNCVNVSDRNVFQKFTCVLFT